MTSLFGKSAVDVLHETRQENHVHVNLNEILQHYKIAAKGLNLLDFEKFLHMSDINEHNRVIGATITTPSGETNIYYCNDYEFMENYQYRYIVAYEVSHLCIAGKPMHFKLKFDDNPKDKEADIFANELLLPLHQLELVSEQLILPTTRNLSKVFEVPETLILARLKYLHREDLAI